MTAGYESWLANLTEDHDRRRCVVCGKKTNPIDLNAAGVCGWCLAEQEDEP